MPNEKLFSVGDFASMSRTTVATLHHYDKIGLLSPVARGINKYRYYSARQLAMINAISTLHGLGVPLAEIKVIKDQRTPELAKELLMMQLDRINTKINAWLHSKKLLFNLLRAIETGLEADTENIKIQFCPAEQIMLGTMNDYSGKRHDYDALYSFYHDMHEQDPELDLNYAVWGIFSKERILRGDWTWPDRYYFYNPDGQDQRPAALYAIGHMRTGYGGGCELYERMIAYIDQNGFEICGDTYEEYPLNEICITNDQNYLMRVMITVCEKTQKT